MILHAFQLGELSVAESLYSLCLCVNVCVRVSVGFSPGLSERRFPHT